MTAIDPAKVRRGHPVYIFGPYNTTAELRRNKYDWSITVGAHAWFGTQEEIFAHLSHFRFHGFIPGENMTVTNADTPKSTQKTIWKYRLPLRHFTIAPISSLNIPGGEDAQILTLQVQDDEPTLWVLLDPESPKQYRHFTLAGTGMALPFGGSYIGTFQVGGFVGHVFEVQP